MYRSVAFCCASTLIALGCVDGRHDVEPSRGASSSSTSALELDDRADHGCQVVLREMGRTRDGFTTADGRWIFEGRVDVADAALEQGAEPMLLASVGDDAWREHAPVASVAVSGGMTRFLFRLDEGDLPGPALPADALAETRVAVIPFLRQDAVRVFDHNRLVDELDTYVMHQGNRFTIEEDGEVCPLPKTTLTFTADGEQSVSGPLVEGDDIVIDYDPARLPVCRAWRHGQPGWTIEAVARFNGSEDEIYVPLIRDGEPVLGSLAIPAGTTSMELYFVNRDVARCFQWDSRAGNNYTFAVEAD